MFLAVPISLFALGLGYKNHDVVSYLFIGASGLVFLIAAVVMGENLLGEIGEQTLTLIGSMMVAFAHFKNYRKCKELECDCHES